MNMNDNQAIDALLNDFPEEELALPAPETAPAPAPRDLPKLIDRKSVV